MNHVMICSLKRGVINPPEPLDYIEEIRVFSENPETRHIQWERDPPMGQKERLIEEGRRFARANLPESCEQEKEALRKRSGAVGALNPVEQRRRTRKLWES